ncbi:hypothetical protein [Longispora albida]|uniref:hypothetical protein n=1 Tax=Longispora albida TaxID=203523 RepID=UPI00037C6B4F|nr:hypothetical protein [Longispora albida]
MLSIKRVSAVAVLAAATGLSAFTGGAAQAATPECVSSFTPTNGGINPEYVAYVGTVTCRNAHHGLTVNVRAWDASKTGNLVDVSETVSYGRTVSVTLRYAPATPNWGFTVDGTYRTSINPTSAIVAVAPAYGPGF